MSTPSDSAQTSEKPKSRQRQGPACAECRRRKLRCDGQQPHCGTCSDLGISCEQTSFTTPRGPKKGHMKALQTRMASLEARLREQTTPIAPVAPPVGSFPDMQMACEIPIIQNTQLPTPPTLDDGSLTFFTHDTSMDLDFNILQSFDYNAEPFEYDDEPEISELVRADLDQTYFERAHSFAPILQRRRYYSWVNQPNKTEAQRGLQYAVWTLASTFSAQSEYLRARLRAAAVNILDRIESRDVSSCQIEIEHAQARVILLIHDLLKASFDLGWRNAATSFRLLQYMRLYDIDSPVQCGKRANDARGEDKLHTEELRRTFWVAYSIDCFINLRSGRPLSFQESAIQVRLPMPEDQFQSGRNSRQSLLSEAMSSFTDHGFCPFSESIIIATICSRAMSHGQQASAENVYGRVKCQLWERHFWIEESLLARSSVLGFDDSQNITDTDGLLIFAKMASQSIMLYLYQILEAKTWIKPEDKDAVLMVKERTIQAAQAVAALSNSLVNLSLFKIHPFTPLLLGFCAEFLRDRHVDFGLDNANVQQMTQLLAEMSAMNRLADYAFATAALPANTPVSL